MWKFAHIIILPKLGKPADEVNSYRPISLLPVTSKLFEKLLLKRVRNDLGLSIITPDHQFGFRGHSTIQQAHGIVSKFITNLEAKYSSFP
jgi:hypothetical protein